MTSTSAFFWSSYTCFSDLFCSYVAHLGLTQPTDNIYQVLAHVAKKYQAVIKLKSTAGEETMYMWCTQLAGCVLCQCYIYGSCTALYEHSWCGHCSAETCKVVRLLTWWKKGPLVKAVKFYQGQNFFHKPSGCEWYALLYQASSAPNCTLLRRTVLKQMVCYKT